MPKYKFNTLHNPSLRLETNVTDNDDLILPVEEPILDQQSSFSELLEDNALLQQVSHRFQELFQGLPLACFCYDVTGRIYEWNRECTDSTGVTAAEALQQLIWNAYAAPNDTRLIQEMVEAVFEGKTFENVEIAAKCKSGATFPVLSSLFPLRGIDGMIVGGICANVNIAERKQAEEALRAASEQLEERVKQRTVELALANQALASEVQERTLYSDIVQNMQIGILVYHLEDENDDQSLRLVATNPAAAALTNSAMEDIIGKLMCEIYPNLALTNFPSTVVQTIFENQSRIIPDIIYKDEQILETAFAVKIFPLPNRCAGVVFENITEQKRAEQEIRRIHDENAQILGSISSILISVNPEDVVTSWNSAAERTFGIATADAVGQRLMVLPIQWEWDKVLVGIAECATSRLSVRLDDISSKNPHGKDRCLGLTINLLSDEIDCFTGYLILGTDITERRTLENQLAQSQKLESIGQLAAGIAHEINTPIQYVGDNTRFLLDAFEELKQLIVTFGGLIEKADSSMTIGELNSQFAKASSDADLEYLMSEVPRAIEQSLEGVSRVAHIVRAMKEFSHPGNDEKAGVDLNLALESTITVARNEWKYIAEMVTDFAPDLPLVQCYPGELNQVLLNLIVNAAHAIADFIGNSETEKGTITIGTRTNGEYVEVSISDTGTGIPQAVQGRIFDPFFTTKAIGKGTGQGLAISHSVIVDKHGGSIFFETEQGIGTTFFIRLPLT